MIEVAHVKPRSRQTTLFASSHMTKHDIKNTSIIRLLMSQPVKTRCDFLPSFILLFYLPGLKCCCFPHSHHSYEATFIKDNESVLSVSNNKWMISTSWWTSIVSHRLGGALSESISSTHGRNVGLPLSHSHLRTISLQSAEMCMFLDLRRKLENPEKTILLWGARALIILPLGWHVVIRCALLLP